MPEEKCRFRSSDGAITKHDVRCIYRSHSNLPCKGCKEMQPPPTLFGDDHKIAVIIKLANATTPDQSAVHTVTNETAPMNKNAPSLAADAPDKGKSTVTHSPITEHDQIR